MKRSFALSRRAARETLGIAEGKAAGDFDCLSAISRSGNAGKRLLREGVFRSKKVSSKLCVIFIINTSSCASEPCRFAVTLRKEGEVAWLESPNGLGATAEFQLRGEVSTTKFPAIL